MTRVSSVEARVVRIPLESTTSFARRAVDQREYCLIRITGDDGVSGIGFCYAGHKCGRLVQDAVLGLFRPLLLGDDAHRTAGLWQDMYQESLLHGRTGSVMRAIASSTSRCGTATPAQPSLPLWRYLGAVATDYVDAYASGGYYLTGKGPEELAAEVRGHVTRASRRSRSRWGDYRRPKTSSGSQRRARPSVQTSC